MTLAHVTCVVESHNDTIASLSDWLEVERPVCTGGMGAIYRARVRASGEAVALKVMQDQHPSFGGRFLREARILSQLWHPGIVRYVAHGTTRDGGAFIAMEWLEGEDLATRLARASLTVSDSVRLVASVAGALATAHELEIVHRDLKPSNLFLVDGDVDRVKILDFGVARLARGSLVTRTGVVVGTPAYMAPEQARGADHVDSRADVFALGCVLFECLTGRPPFDASHPVAVMAQIIFEEAPRVSRYRPGVPRALDDLVARMLAKDVAQRPEDAASVRQELVALGEIGEPESAPKAPRKSGTILTNTERRLMCAILVADALPQDSAARAVADADRTIPDSPGLARTMDGETSAPHIRESLSLYETLRDIVGEHGGRLTPLADGSLIAVIAGEGAATDLAARAARCALAMRIVIPAAPMALATGREVLGGQLPVGEVIARQVDLLRTGDAAAIHLDEVTCGLLDARFDVGGDDHGLHLRGMREFADAPRKLLGRPTECVGRERELSLLEEIYRECIEEPVARSVLITAPAGVGKTRLRQELIRRLTADGDRVEIWSAQADPTGRALPFELLGRAVRRGIGIRDSDRMSVQRSKLRARVRRHYRGDDIGRVCGFLGEVLQITQPGNPYLRAARVEPAGIEGHVREVWDHFLRAECSEHPVIVVLEDLHWADITSIKYIDAALRSMRDLPLFVVGTARLEVHERFPGIWFDRGVEEIRLHALRRSTCNRLVKSVLGLDTPREVVRSLVERSSGNAFYLEELMRAHARGSRDASTPTVLAMVQSRLESFPPPARRILRAASVFGGSFCRSGLVALLGPSEEASSVDHWLELLEDQEVIARHGDGGYAGEVEYGFLHAYMREAAYEMLTDDDRELAGALADVWKSRHLANARPV